MSFCVGAAGTTGKLMELPTPAADSANVLAMETSPPTQASKGESPSAGPAPSSAVPAAKDKEQVGGASISGINGMCTCTYRTYGVVNFGEH